MQEIQFWQENSTYLHESPDYCHSSATRGAQWGWPATLSMRTGQNETRIFSTLDNTT